MTNQSANPNELAAQAPADFPIVGIGTTGDIAALEKFFQAVPEDNGLAFILVMHLPAHRKRKLGEVLQQTTSMAVTQAEDGMRIQPDHIYVAPPGRVLHIERGQLCLSPADAKRNRRTIDAFFQSLAADQGANAIAIILSGAGVDGVQGLAAVKAQGGFTLVQTPEEAEQADLPLRALATNQVDVMGPAQRLAQQLLGARGKLAAPMPHTQATEEQGAEEQTVLPPSTDLFNAILVELHTQTGHDFSHYKPSTILRRIARRLQMYAIDNLKTYLTYLRQHPDETHALVKDCLISVTNFFRDPEDFAALEKTVVPQILASKRQNEIIRIWVPGCATGEEAYSLAMLFYEQAAQMFESPRLQIFATDIDEEAISVARRGLYPESIVNDVTPTRLQRFFSKESEGYRVKLELREIVLFAVHNLLKDPPFSKLDLISCRNLLIYLNREAQEKTFELFHYALAGAPAALGYLFLGTSESADAAATLFATNDKRYHLFQRREAITTPRRLPATTMAIMNSKIFESASQPVKPKVQSVEDLYQQWTLRRYAPPRVLVNENYEITHIFNGADRYLREREGAVTQNILLKVLPELRLDLRSALYQALNKDEHTDSRLLRVQLNKEWCLIQLHVGPVPEPGFPKEYVEVVFEERQETAAVGLPAADATLDVDNSLISRLEEELLRTRARLQTIIEEHEIANHELKASNEELQSINEELKSTTEELETSKEELQSMNEELVTVNHELKLKIEELGRVNSDLLNLMASTDVGALFLDQSLRIKRFTPRATELFHLIETDVGRPFAHISSRLRHTRLIELAARVLSTLEQIEEIVQSDNDRWSIMRMFPYRTVDNQIDGVVITVVDITELKRAEHEIEQRIQQQTVAELGRQALESDDIDALMRMAAQRAAEILHMEFAKVLEAQADGQTLRFKAGVGWSVTSVTEATLATPDNTQSWYTFHEDQPVIVENISQENRFQPSPMLSAHNIVSGVTVVIPGHEALYGVLGVYSREPRTFTSYEVDFLQAVANVLAEALARKAVEDALRTSETRFRHLADAMPQIVWVSDAVGTLRYVNQGWLDYSGIPLADNLRDGVWAAVHPDDAPANRVAWEQALQTGIAYEAELRLRNREGHYRWYLERGAPVRDANGVVLEWYTTATDIDDRKQAEEQLRYHAYLLENIEDAVIATDKQLRVTAWNRGAEQIYGWQADEVLGRPVQAVVNSNLTSEQRKPLLQEVDQNKRAIAEVMYHHHKDGTLLQLEANTIALHDADQQITGYISINRDIHERKQAEQQIRFQANLLDVVEQAVIAIDQTGKIIYWNRFAEKLYGWRADEVHGRNAAEVIPNNTTQEQAAAMSTQFRDGKSWSGEFMVQRHDGTSFPAQVLNSPIYADGGVLLGFVGVSVDITERKQVQAALERYQLMAEHMHEIIMFIDTDGRIVEANQAAVATYGYDYATLLTKRLHDLRDPTTLTTLPVQIQRASEGDILFEARHRHANGMTFPVEGSARGADIEGKRLILSIFRDVTERKAAEATLRRQSLMLEQTHDAIFMWDIGGSITYWNQGAERLYGYTKTEAIGQISHNLLQTVHPQPFEHFESVLQQDGEWTGELQHITKDGRAITVLSRHQRYEHEGKAYILETSHDITERKEAEQALYKNNILLQGVINGTNDGIYVRDVTGRYLLVNDIGAAIVGLTREQMLGQSYQALFPAEIVDAIQAEDAPVLMTGELQRNETFSMIDNVLHTFHSVRTPYRDFQGNIIGVLNVVRDISDLKQIEETLRESEARFRMMADTAPVLVWMADADALCSFFNKPWLNFTGRRLEQELGNGWLEGIHPEDYDRCLTLYLTAFAARQPFEMEYRLRHASGEYRWVVASAVPRFEADNQFVGYIGSCIDITDRKQAEETLRDSVEQLQLATTAANMGIWYWDSESDILTWNDQCKALFGLTPDVEATYELFLNILDPRDRAHTAQAVERTLREEIELNVEYRTVWPDASIHWLTARGRGFYDKTGNARRLLGVMFDITERKETEEKLSANAVTIRQQLAEIEAIYATTPVGLAVLDRDLRQVRINEQLAAINGRPIAEHIGRRGIDLVPDIAKTLDAQLRQIIVTGEPLLNLEITGFTPAQPAFERTWLGSFYPLRAMDGQVSGINVVIQEITDRKRHERELQELNKTLELRVAERTTELEARTQELIRRNRELDQFAYVASHDLKAPLRAIDNLSAWVVQDAQALLPVSSKEHLDKLRGRVRRMEKLLDDLLDYSRADRYQYTSEIVELETLIADIIKLFTVPEGFTIAVDTAIPPLNTERVPLELVLRNLINNAIKHHTVQSHNRQDEPIHGHVQITAHDCGDFVEFAVADNGPGIAPQFHERIFQMFQTLRPRDQVEGSGMGLAIVKKIVESRGGQISVTSDIGQGATFRFTWPK
ncbi:MAG: PAS domain S-box protein [Chloroflexi bacterium]|nr:PAS domain S-box protein [Chloroflexota bacterium]